uniref:Putative methyltransferase KIAA1456 n=1 Tax=Bactrocera latifrons TaxID=174628 RepID=A0A0K8UMG1_BACLA
MLTSCLTIASSTNNSSIAANDVFAGIHSNLDDDIFRTDFANSLEANTYTFQRVSMTKQLSTSSPTTNGDRNASNFVLAPLAPLANNDTTLRGKTDSTGTEADICNTAKAPQKSNSNYLTLLPKSQAASSLASINSGNDEASSKKTVDDTNGRSAALERAYVHDVYENCDEPSGAIRPRIAQFLNNLDPGAVVCDVGCGNGRYLAHGNRSICTVGVDRCYRLSKVAREKGGEVIMCDNLELPFRDNSFDAVLSLAVVHHFATTERRVNALRELARVLRIGGRVIITVWALEQRHRRFESQDVLIPWQPPKIRNMSCSDEEDDESFLPPYHAYTEDSTNSSRSAGDGDSSSLSSSSPGESCYSFVRRAIQKLAAGRKHPWFLDSWASKETKNDSSLDFEDVKDLPIELRRLEDFEDFYDPPLSAGLKSRSLGSILNPPPRQIVRSRSSVPSLGGTLFHLDMSNKSGIPVSTYSMQNSQHFHSKDLSVAPVIATKTNVSPTKSMNAVILKNINNSTPLGRRPKLIKQKQSFCDEECQLPENSFHIKSTYNNHSASNSLYLRNRCYFNGNNININSQTVGKMPLMDNLHHQSPLTARQMMQASIFLRKQSSLNEELMAVNRLREKEGVRKRIQKQTSLNEAFLCQSTTLSKKFHIIRENFTKKVKTSTGSFERVTKTGLNKLVQNFSSYISPSTINSDLMEKVVSESQENSAEQSQSNVPKCNKYHHHHHYQYAQHQQSLNLQNYQCQSRTFINTHETGSQASHYQKQLSVGSVVNKYAGPVTYCNNAECSNSGCYCSTYHYVGCNTFCTTNDGFENRDGESRRHSKESGSDSSKDSSLQSDTSIESEDSFASVIFIPKPEQQQQQLNYHQSSNSSSSNSSSSNGGGGCRTYGSCCQHQNDTCKLQNNDNTANCLTCLKHLQQPHHQRLSSVPTSPMILACPPTPAHSPATTQAVITSPPRTVATVTAAMAMLTPPSDNKNGSLDENSIAFSKINMKNIKDRFDFDEDLIKQHERDTAQHQQEDMECKITRNIIKNLPPIPKFRKQSLQPIRQSFPIIRRSSATSSSSIPNMPKLMSLELFNPATDDLDSDSSEASTPNSIDSVISTGKSNSTTTTIEQSENMKSSPTFEQDGNDGLLFERTIKTKKQQYHDEQLKTNNDIPHNIFLNEEDSCPIPPNKGNINLSTNSLQRKEQGFVGFAEQLNIQLMRKIDDKNDVDECVSLEITSEYGDPSDAHINVNRKRSNELRDLSAIREELRERRLMLANLSTQPSLQQSPTSSTSSLSSQTRSFTIHEENEEESDERSYSLQLYENCKISKINYKRNRPYNLNPETAYLLQDEGDIFDEEEENELGHLSKHHHSIGQETQYQPKDEFQVYPKAIERAPRCDTIGLEVAAEKEGYFEIKVQHESKETEKSLQNRQSTESWGNSNSSAGSLESPSQGGSTTHHRYYHVFREGELDALINHHVASLHIVSSYYERSSWCVVAEKVQVWTI